MDRRRFVRTAFAAAGAGSLAGCSLLDSPATSDEPTGTQPPEEGTEATTNMSDLQFRSTAFDEGASIPETYTCDGEDVSPPLVVEGVAEAETLAVIVDDPDAPGGTFTHWLLWNLPADVTEIPEAIPTTQTVEELDGARQGTNDFEEVGYRGPCPPEGDDPHTYRFRLYALSESIRVGAGARRKETVDAIRDVQQATVEFTATYGR